MNILTNLGLGIVTIAAMSPAYAAVHDATDVIAAASKAMGCDSLHTIEYVGSGYDFAIGQAGAPDLPWPRFLDKAYTRDIDFDAPASRMQRTRAQGEYPPRGGGLQPVIGDQQQNQVVGPGSAQGSTLYDDLMMSVPCGFVKAAARAGSPTVSSKSVGGKHYTTLTFAALNHASTTGFLAGDDTLDHVETKTDNPVLGDMLYEARFSDYKDYAGVRFPAHIVQLQGGFPVLDLSITDVKPNVSVNIPATPAAPPPAVPVTTEKLGDGVYLIGGGYMALAVEFKDYIVVIEGPQNDQRAQAIIDESKKLIPNKPIKFVINTHNHFDHAGGLRAFVAEGATIVTHRINKPYYQKVWATPHTLVPDRLAQHPVKPTFKLVDEDLVMTDGAKSIELHHMRNFPHNDGMLLIYLPKEKVLVEADGFNPPARALTQTPGQISPYTVGLVDNIERLKLDIDRIIPIHYPADNRKTTTAELRIAAGRAN